jgi:hypothetical protein
MRLPSREQNFHFLSELDKLPSRMALSIGHIRFPQHCYMSFGAVVQTAVMFCESPLRLIGNRLIVCSDCILCYGLPVWG